MTFISKIEDNNHRLKRRLVGILLWEIVKIIAPFNFPKVKRTFGKFLQVKYGTFQFTISLK